MITIGNEHFMRYLPGIFSIPTFNICLTQCDVQDDPFLFDKSDLRWPKIYDTVYKRPQCILWNAELSNWIIDGLAEVLTNNGATLYNLLFYHFACWVCSLDRYFCNRFDKDEYYWISTLLAKFFLLLMPSCRDLNLKEIFPKKIIKPSARLHIAWNPQQDPFLLAGIIICCDTTESVMTIKIQSLQA